MIPVRTGMVPDEKAMIPVRMGLIPDENAMIPVRTRLIPDFWDDSDSGVGGLASESIISPPAHFLGGAALGSGSAGCGATLGPDGDEKMVPPMLSSTL